MALEGLDAQVEVAYCDRCSKRVVGTIYYDADGRVADSEGFMRFRGKTMCDDCLGEAGEEMLSEQESANVPTIVAASEGLASKGLIFNGAVGYPPKLTQAGVTAYLAEKFNGGGKVALTGDERRLLRILVESPAQGSGVPSTLAEIVKGLKAGRWVASFAAVCLSGSTREVQ